MRPGFFITGTDTDIGKTYVSRQLADTFAKFLSVTYAKPIQTGCKKNNDGKLLAPDFDYVIAGDARMTASYEKHVPYRYEPACSPHLAARLAGEKIQIEPIVEAMQTVSDGADCTLVEGAGGLLVPLNDSHYMLDLIVALSLPVILVTSPKLGTLNHTFLSYKALIERNIPVAAIVYNQMVSAVCDYIFEDNRHTIEETIAPTPLFYIGNNDSFSQHLLEFCHHLARKFL
ncbi:MAG: dethiobiotin synthase [Chitinispirillaceae bacterium]